MKKLIKILSIAFVGIIGVLSTPTAYAYDNFVIETYLVNINVLENNVVEVEEIIYADFEYESHGIYRDIPIKGIFSREVDGELIENKYKAKISDIEVVNQKYTTDKSGNYQTIKIGDKDVYVLGMQKYEIHYKIDFGDDGIEDFDEFYFNVIGTDWSTNINNVAVTITMPKEFDEEYIGLSTGYAGESGTDILKYQVDDNEITIHTTQALYPYEGLTMRLQLPEGYFVNERVPFDWVEAFYYGVGLLVAFVALLWLTEGKDEKLYPAVEFYPPEDLPPAEVGYIVDGCVDTKDVLSLLMYWADKGYIKIVEPKKNDFYLVKLNPLDDSAEYYEQRMFIDLFKGRQHKHLDELIDLTAENPNLSGVHNMLLEKQANGEKVAYVRVKELQNKFYSTIDIVKSNIKKKYTKKEKGMIFTGKSMLIKVLAFMVCTLPIYIGNIIVTASKSMYMDDAIIGGIFWCAILLTVIVVTDRLIARRKSMKRSTKITLTVIFAIVLALLAFISILIIADAQGERMFAYAAVGATYLIAFFAMFMEKRTPDASKMQEKILGLRMFLINAEKDRIERLVDENPDYFFNILSYAYVLGVTDKWASQFEELALKKPDWYESHNMNTRFMPMTFTRNFAGSVDSMRTTMTSRPSSSSSGGGSSYSGGGGFSGGGGGGGGGGSW